MTQLGPRIEPITSPTPGECATSYATDTGYDVPIQKLLMEPSKFNHLPYGKYISVVSMNKYNAKISDTCLACGVYTFSNYNFAKISYKGYY